MGERKSWGNRGGGFSFESSRGFFQNADSLSQLMKWLIIQAKVSLRPPYNPENHSASVTGSGGAQLAQATGSCSTSPLFEI